MGAASSPSQGERQLCHCGQEATNATRIIHDNYDQVRAERKAAKTEAASGTLIDGAPTLLPPLHSEQLASPRVLLAGRPGSIWAGLTAFADFLGSPFLTPSCRSLC